MVDSVDDKRDATIARLHTELREALEVGREVQEEYNQMKNELESVREQLQDVRRELQTARDEVTEDQQQGTKLILDMAQEWTSFHDKALAYFKEFMEEVTCPICMERTTAYVVQCGHAFCGECLERHFSSSVNSWHDQFPGDWDRYQSVVALIADLSLDMSTNTEPVSQEDKARLVDALFLHFARGPSLQCATCSAKLTVLPVPCYALSELSGGIVEALGSDIGHSSAEQPSEDWLRYFPLHFLRDRLR